MLTNEQLDKYTDELRGLIGKKDGIIYLADGKELPINNGQTAKVNGVVFTIEKEKYAIYLYVVANLLANGNEVARIAFVKPEDWGDFVEPYNKDLNFNGQIFDIKDFEQFCKDFNVAGPNVELYKAELACMEENLEGYKNFLKDNGINV